MRPRLTAMLSAVGPTIVVVPVYIGVASATGTYTGLTDMGGWDLYARVAPFADCRDFAPPAGTARLCESTPPGLRNGPFWYAWNQQSHGQTLVGTATPKNERVPGDFARAVLENQPIDYLHAVVKDFTRYADPNVGTIRTWSGEGPETVSFEQGRIDPGTSHMLVQALGGYWSGITPHMTGVVVLDEYQSATRIIGFVWWLLWGLAVFALLAARRPVRIAALMFGLSAFALYLLPVMTVSWDWRYGVPAQFALVAAPTLGAWTISERVKEARRVRPRPSPA